MAAYELLYRSHRDGLLHRIIRPRVASMADAEDVLSSTFASALERLGEYREMGRPFGAWLTRIAINACYDQGRRTSRDDRRRGALAAVEKTPLPIGDELLIRAADRSRAAAEVSAVLGAINPRYAHAIRLRLLEGLERDDCARELGVTTPTFDVVLLRAVRAFRARWDDDFGEVLS